MNWSHLYVFIWSAFYSLWQLGLRWTFMLVFFFVFLQIVCFSKKPYGNEPWFYYSKSVVTMYFWHIDYYLYNHRCTTNTMFMVSVAKLWFICGYHGLTIVIMFYSYIVYWIHTKKLSPEILIFSWDVAELRILFSLSIVRNVRRDIWDKSKCNWALKQITYTSKGQ